jgi:hypothetical protein
MRYVLGLVVALGVTAGAATASTTVVPSVQIMKLSPLQLRGAHFFPAEKVHVTATAGNAKLVRTVRTSADGGFTVTMGSIAATDRCSGIVAVAALGVRGDTATLHLPRPMCPVSPAEPGLGVGASP